MDAADIVIRACMDFGTNDEWGGNATFADGRFVVRVEGKRRHPVLGDGLLGDGNTAVASA